MALTNCIECNNSISTQAKSCPHCGYELNKTNSYHSVPLILSFFFPGLGQLAKGDIRVAITIMLLNAVSVLGFFSTKNPLVMILLILYSLVLYIWNLINAYKHPNGKILFLTILPLLYFSLHYILTGSYKW